jgi:hypothetical protein
MALGRSPEGVEHDMSNHYHNDRLSSVVLFSIQILSRALCPYRDCNQVVPDWNSDVVRAYVRVLRSSLCTAQRFLLIVEAVSSTTATTC